MIVERTIASCAYSGGTGTLAGTEYFGRMFLIALEGTVDLRDACGLMFSELSECINRYMLMLMRSFYYKKSMVNVKFKINIIMFF